ncbi:hypothetical protein KP22_01520 [Pectobacterium betavasculorum]|uniref:Glycosyltransferase 2-like domain-containing protein n=1 Tax=Pectobacterium betavasculorum TaxID=55207 RepID=A0A093S9I8_9GAMM|nr:glycosyltransferase family 2 protein [Pectobacterium betavasculorum]KFX06796.1 hypothetical protein KP22_01520 [Pectobacterium betavasculorum]
MKTLAVVVFYNPEGDYFNRCLLIASQVDELIVYDNSIDESVITENKKNILKIDNAIYYSEGVNNGIGKALNYAVIKSKEGGYDLLFTFDQDTEVPSSYVKSLISSYLSEKNIGAIGPIYKDINVNRECRFPVSLGPFVVRKTLSGESKIQDVLSIITSGTLYPVKIFDKIGFFDEDFFIDYIDNEFCLRLQKNGYRVCVEPKICINHALGNRTVKKSIVKFSPTNYPFYRKYYITRNRLFVYKLYFLKYPGFVFYDFSAFALDFLRVILFESDKINKLKAYFYGVKHFILNKKGKIPY